MKPKNLILLFAAALLVFTTSRAMASRESITGGPTFLFQLLEIHEVLNR